jgi:hypothetical protein
LDVRCSTFSAFLQLSRFLPHPSPAPFPPLSRVHGPRSMVLLQVSRFIPHPSSPPRSTLDVGRLMFDVLCISSGFRPHPSSLFHMPYYFFIRFLRIFLSDRLHAVKTRDTGTPEGCGAR